MVHLTDKDALVAEIEKLQLCTMDEHMNFYSTEAQGEYNALSKLESFLDTLEVKEVDLEKEIAFQWEGCDCDDTNLYAKVSSEQFKAIAKHFFELGLKSKQC